MNTTFQEAFHRGWLIATIKRPLKKALKRKHEVVIVKAYGVNEMTRLLNIGFEIVSHSPSNYAHADNRYVMSMPTKSLQAWLGIES